jgi:hypothetical protein
MLIANRAACRALAALALTAGLGAAPLAGFAQEDGGWVGTWSASPQPDWGPDFFAPVGIPRSLRDQTIRQVARVSLGGEQVRVEFSNEYGDQPMVIGAAHVAMARPDGSIDPATGRALTFDGRPSATIPPGAPLWSDPVDLPVEALDSLAVSLYLPEVTPTTTWHTDGRPPGSVPAIRPRQRASSPTSRPTRGFSSAASWSTPSRAPARSCSSAT